MYGVFIIKNRNLGIRGWAQPQPQPQPQLEHILRLCMTG